MGADVKDDARHEIEGGASSETGGADARRTKAYPPLAIVFAFGKSAHCDSHPMMEQGSGLPVSGDMGWPLPDLHCNMKTKLFW